MDRTLYTGGFVLLLVLIRLNLVQTKDVCPSGKCSCYVPSKDEFVVDCSGASLKKFPTDLPKHTTQLNLSNNSISTLENSTLCQTKNLKYLDLSQNGISVIHSKAFNCSSKLHYLDISKNNLRDDQFKDDLFVNMSSLRVMHMQHSNLTEYPHRALEKCRSLESLVIDGLPSKTFGVGFQSVRNLSYLSLSGFETNCYLANLYNETFKYIENLRYLNISKCAIDSLDAGTFSPLKDIFLVNMSDNAPEENGMKLIRNASYSLQNTSIEVLIVDRLINSTGVGILIKYSDVEFFKDLPLKILSGSDNRFEYIEPKAASSFPPSIEIVVAQYNSFVYGPYLRELQEYQHLRKVYGDYANDYANFSLPGFQENIHNEIKELEHRRRYRIYNETERFLENPRLESSEEKLPDKKEHNVSSIYNNVEKHLHQDQVGSSYISFLPNSLSELYLSSSKINYALPKMVFNVSNSISLVNMSSNIIYSWIGPILNLHKLTDLDLSRNYCYELDSDFFSDMINLERLDIGINFLGYPLKYDSHGSIFRNLSQLRTLNLTRNRITELQKETFRGLRNIEQIDISENSLRDLDVDLTHMLNLTVLDLTNNELETIPESTRTHLAMLAEKKGMNVRLNNNKIDCSCENVHFLKWMRNSGIHFENIGEYKCFGTLKGQYFNNGVIETLEKQCADWTAAIVGGSICVVIFIIAMICLLLYKRRWKLKYIYYMTVGRYTLLQEEKEERSVYKYNAFISYHHSKGDFVKQKLLPELEDRRNLSLCAHQRDFTPGHSIAANIVDAIQNSKKTIVLVSREYLRSNWCMFEFNMARMESMYKRGSRSVVFLVMMDMLTAREMPLILLDLIESQTYIEYPGDEQGDVKFWNRIHEQIKVKRVTMHQRSSHGVP